MKIAIVGAGVFGAAAACELARRGHAVTLLDPGPPHPLAASTDISKLIRMDYGADLFYTAHMEEALRRWKGWNARQPRPLFHDVGLLALASEPFSPGGFEHDSLSLMQARGHHVERLDSDAIRSRFPAWNAEFYVEASFNPRGGWAESGAVVAWLLDEATAAGVRIRRAKVEALLERGGQVRGVRLADEAIEADRVIAAVGAWTPSWLPPTGSLVRAVGQPVFHLLPPDPAPYRPPRFPPWAADIGRSGWYGFPANADGLVKVANHGPGRPMHPEDPREPSGEQEAALRAFLARSLPDLAEAPIVGRRLCLYCDSRDGDFLVDEHPALGGLVLATGGSGHAFKFAPLLGDWIADRALGAPPLPRFAWRDVATPTREQARFDPERA